MYTVLNSPTTGVDTDFERRTAIMTRISVTHSAPSANVLSKNRCNYTYKIFLFAEQWFNTSQNIFYPLRLLRGDRNSRELRRVQKQWMIIESWQINADTNGEQCIVLRAMEINFVIKNF